MSLLKSHWIYHLIDADGVVVYIGRSINPKSRWRTHQRLFDDETLQLKLDKEFSCITDAQREEIKQISKLRPRLNKYVASSPSRFGMGNSAEHNKAISDNQKRKTKEDNIKTGLKGWETRDRTKPGPMLDKKHSEEVKALLSEKSRIHNAKYGNAFLGRRHSDETKQRLREASTGRKQSEETKQKLRLVAIANGLGKHARK